MHPVSVRTLATLALLALAAAPVSVRRAAGEDAPTREEYEQRIQRLEEDIKELKKDTRKLEVGEEEKSRLKPIAGWNDGFFIQTPDGNNKIGVGGYAQLDGRFFLDKGDQGTSQFLFRRARLDVKGTFLKYFDFRLLEDFATGAVTQDLWLMVKYFPWARLWVGKYKTPFGIERLQSALALLFIERALPNNLVPNRDLGFMLNGDLFNGAFTYNLAILNGVPDGASSNNVDINDDKIFAGRIFAHPFKDTPLEPVRGLGLGIAGTAGRETGNVGGPNLPRYVTQGQSTFFSYVTNSPATADGTAIADGAQSRISPQAYWYWGQFGSLAEYVWTGQRVALGDVNDFIQNDAWQTRVGWVLTGEKASYKGVMPDRPIDFFDLLNGNYGAFEVGARYSELHVDNSAFALGFANPSRSAKNAREWTIGVNWYWNRNVLWALDFGRTTFNGGAANGGDRTPEEVIEMRTQFVF